LKISVIIPAYNNEKTIANTLRSLKPLAKQVEEIILVNDGSADRTAEIAAAFGVRMINTPHAGRSHALNAGINAAKGRVLFFTDGDCEVPKNWISMHKALYKKYRGLDGISGLQMPKERTFIETFKISRYLREIENEILMEKYAGICLNGNNMSITKEALLDVSGFDETFVKGADCDLTERLLKKGRRLLRTPHIAVMHVKKETLPQFLKTAFHRSSGVVLHQMKRGEFSALRTAISFFYVPLGRLFQHGNNFRKMRGGMNFIDWAAFASLFIMSYYAGRLGNVYYWLRFKKFKRAHYNTD